MNDNVRRVIRRINIAPVVRMKKRGQKVCGMMKMRGSDTYTSDIETRSGWVFLFICRHEGMTRGEFFRRCW